MIREEWIIELHNLARKVEQSGRPDIAKSMRYDADRLSEALEKAKINQRRGNIDG